MVFFFFTDSKLKLINLVKSCKFFCKICPDLFVDAVVAAESVRKKNPPLIREKFGLYTFILQVSL